MNFPCKLNGATVSQVTFDGFQALELVSATWKAVLVYEIGPRIAFFGKPEGENLLYWDKDAVKRGPWRLRGGHRVWLTRPMADESVDTYWEDNQVCALTAENGTIVATAPANVNGLERGMALSIGDNGELVVTNFVTNAGDLIYSGGVWSPTCVVPDGKRLIIPLGDETTNWDIVRIVVPRVFAGNTSTLEDDQCYFQGNDMIVEPKGRMLKRVCSAPKGLVQLDCGDYIFQKHAPYNPLYRYPFEGCNVAVFVGQDNWMAELETFAGEGAILPGQTVKNTEYWSLQQR